MPKKKEEINEEIENKVEDNQGIIVTDPEDFRPKDLPLIIQLPAGASKAQIEFAKVLNGYAYSNPDKWREKKDDRLVNGKKVKGLLTKLREKKNAPDPVSNEKLSFKNKLRE